MADGTNLKGQEGAPPYFFQHVPWLDHHHHLYHCHHCHHCHRCHHDHQRKGLALILLAPMSRHPASCLATQLTLVALTAAHGEHVA
jgi:hypothetical protein